MKSIQVIMATYNGSKFIEEQIDSILLNFNKISEYNCQLLISDDCSSDNTQYLINRYVSKDNRIVFIDGSRKGGVINNFSYLINHCTADYVFFSDQDDFWLPNKMKIFMERFAEIEKDSNEPVLVHSDLSVVDKNLSPINISMFSYQKLNKNPTLSELIVSNSVTGCVMACNHKLIHEVQGDIICGSIMHDWFIALFASTFGVLSYIDKPLILYRQHNENQVGAKSIKLKDLFKIDTFINKIRKSRQAILNTKKQAEKFILHFRNKEGFDGINIYKNYIKSFDSNFIFRLRLFLFSKFRKNCFERNILYFILYILRC
jgi:glycosyltransferase involved in cell wall biosynthesis